MHLTLTPDDLARLKPETLSDLFGQIKPPTAKRELAAFSQPTIVTSDPAVDDEIDLEDVVDLTPSQVADLVDGLNEKAVDGLKAFAEHGPRIDIRLLDAVGIASYGRFQAAVTRRTRTITGDEQVLLFGWDEWAWDEATDSQVGHYAVSQATYESLRAFFGL